MKNKLKTVLEHRDAIHAAAARYGIRRVSVFGSVARGEYVEGSDIDFLVEIESGRSLFDLGGFQVEMEELFGCRVDVVTNNGLKPDMRAETEEEAVAI